MQSWTFRRSHPTHSFKIQHDPDESCPASSSQTLQEEVRLQGDSVAVEWGQLLPLPVSPFLCGKQDVTR